MYPIKNRFSLVCFCLLILVTMETSITLAGHRPGHKDLNVEFESNDFELKNRDLVIRDGSNRRVIRIDAQSGDIRIFDVNGKTVGLIKQNSRDMWLGGNGKGGDLVLLPAGKTRLRYRNASVHIDGDDGSQRLGGAGTDGKLLLQNRQGKQRIFLDANSADLILGQEGADGDIVLRNAKGTQMVALDGAKGKIQAHQIISKHSASAGSSGIDTASVYILSNNPAIGLIDNTSGNKKGWMIDAGSGGTLNFRSGDLNSVNPPFFVFESGRLRIGAPKTQMPNAKLIVGGTIGAKEIIVSPSGWADDVFDPKYPLHSIEELEVFLQENRHLPGIPSEKSVMTHGLAIAEFNANILRNVEELTLRVIKHSNEIRTLRESQTREIEAITAVYEERIAKFERALVTLASEKVNVQF